MNSVDGSIDSRLENGVVESQILDELMDIFDSQFENDVESSRTFVEILLGRINPPGEVTDDEIYEHKLTSEEISKLRWEFEKYIKEYLEI